MYKVFYVIAAVLVLATVESSYSQVFKKADPVICPIDHNSYETFIPPPQKFIDRSKLRSSAQSDIQVNYNGFTEEAKAAYQYAVDIWASLLQSPVKIIVNANFTPLGEGVLGSAGPSNYLRDFDGAPLANTFYPIPLAEKLAATDFNGIDEADINSNFNSDFDFYFGIDGNPPSDQYDFVSIVLHELGHGLGFSGGASFEENSGSWTLGSTDLPSIYSKFVEVGENTPITTLSNNSAETAEALTGDNLFFNGPLSVSELRTRPKLFAPSSWNSGSSYSHLDESTYRAGNPNSLMSPQFGAGEAIHDPGITLEIFADMGWVHTYLKHENQNQITENTTNPFLIELSVTSDTTLSTLNPTIIYSTDDFATTQSVTMTDSGNGINFTGEIPNPGTIASIKYYMEGVQDAGGRSYQSPQTAPDDYYEINILNLNRVSVPYSLSDGGDFESNQDDFQSLALQGAIDIWEIGTPGNQLDKATSGSTAWKTKLNEDVGDPGKRFSSALISPTFDFSDDTKNHDLSFNFQMENGYTEEIGLFKTGPFGFHVQFSTDNGATWALLGETNDQAGSNWYNVSEDEPQVFPSASNAGWIQQTINVVDGDTTFIPLSANYNVSFLTGLNQVTFRFVFYGSQGFREEGYQADGVLIDDFQITKSSPTAEFKVSGSDFVFLGDAVSFEYISTGASSFAWDFGDGSTSNLENPSHTYSEGGVYDVTLTITSPDGDATSTKESLVTVLNSKTVPYSLADGGDLESTPLDFTIDNISGTGFELGQSSILGKSGTASGENAFVTDINASAYEDDSEAYIYLPEFSFESIGNYGISFETNYSFEDNWDGFIVEYTLDRGDNWIKLNDNQEEGWYNQISDPLSVFGNQVPIFSGNTGNEFEKKTTDISFLGGESNVSFRIKFLTDAAETDAGMAIDNFEISGPAPGPAVPDFSSNITSGCEGSTITFSNESTGSIKSLQWNFGEGAVPSTATGVGPHEVIYENAGAYSVTLTAIDINDQSATEEKQELIIIEEQHVPTVTASEANEAGEIVLTASEGDIYQWFYQDAIIVGETDKTITVTNSGDYKVSVTINGCEGISENTVILSNTSPLTKSFSLYPNPLDKSNLLNFSFENDHLGPYFVEIYSLNGLKVFSKEFNKIQQKEEQSIRLAKRISGLYLVKVTTGKQQTQLKIFIK